MFLEIQKFSGFFGLKGGTVDRYLSWSMTDNRRERVSQPIVGTRIGGVSYENKYILFQQD